MEDGGHLASSSNNGVGGTFGESGELNVDSWKGKVLIYGAEELDTMLLAQPVNGIRLDNGVDGDCFRRVDSALGKESL